LVINNDFDTFNSECHVHNHGNYPMNNTGNQNTIPNEFKGRYKTGGTGQLYDGFPDCEWKMNTP
jgi:hypothetical protein